MARKRSSTALEFAWEAETADDADTRGFSAWAKDNLTERVLLPGQLLSSGDGRQEGPSSPLGRAGSACGPAIITGMHVHDACVSSCCPSCGGFTVGRRQQASTYANNELASMQQGPGL